MEFVAVGFFQVRITRPQPLSRGNPHCEERESGERERMALKPISPSTRVSDSIMIDMCMPGETTITGRKLFAHLDWRIQRRDPLGGAVCRCTAESTHWPTTNTIAVFVVDVRLNVARQAQCSEVNTTATLTCSHHAHRHTHTSRNKYFIYLYCTYCVCVERRRL